MIDRVKALFRKLPFVRTLVAQRDELLADREQLRSERENRIAHLDQLQAENKQLWSEIGRLSGELSDLKDRLGFAPPGHFYSPIPSLDEVRDDEQRIFKFPSEGPAGIELDSGKQLKLLESMLGFYDELPFTAEKQDGLRYYYDNPAFGHFDAILLYCMIRHLRPGRMIEVGSGFSSALILDTNERFLDGSMDLTFIEPHPELLCSLLKEPDRARVRIIPSRLQEVDLEEFDVLAENDILFIDSTHVSKVGSDVNRIIFDILPRLSKGVYVHFHDIMYPFEYPMQWVYEGRAWNEAYILRAFLQFNREFTPVLMNTYLHRVHEGFLKEHMPLCLENIGGSLWLRRE